MHLIQQPGLPHNYAPPSSLHNSQTLGRIPSHVNQAGKKNTQIPHQARKITPLIPSPPLYILVRGSGIERAFKDKEVGFSNSIVPLISTLVFAHYSHPCC